MTRNPVVIVTGGSSGIGLAAARALRERGCKVYIISRHPYSEKGLHHICGNVSDEKQCQQAVEEVLRREENVDILVNCAGFGISGAVEFTELAAAKKQMDVNFFGTVNMTKAALPHMRQRGVGEERLLQGAFPRQSRGAGRRADRVDGPGGRRGPRGDGAGQEGA